MLLANLVPKLTVSGATSSCNNSKSCLLNPNSKGVPIESTIRTAKFLKGKNNNVSFNNYLKKIFNTKKPDNEIGENPKSELTLSKINSNGKNGLKPGFVFIDNRGKKSGVDDGTGDHKAIIKLLESKGPVNKTDVKSCDESKLSCNKKDAEKKNVRLGITVKDCDVHADIKDVLNKGKRTDITAKRRTGESEGCNKDHDAIEKKSDQNKKETNSNKNKTNECLSEASKNKKPNDSSEGKSDSCKKVTSTSKNKSESIEKQNNTCQSYLDQIKKIKNQNEGKLKDSNKSKSSEREKKTAELKSGPTKNKSTPCKKETDSTKSSSGPCKKEEIPCESESLKIKLEGNLCEIKIKEPEKKKQTENIPDALKKKTNPLDSKHDPCKKKTNESKIKTDSLKKTEEPNLSKTTDPCASASVKQKDDSESCAKSKSSKDNVTDSCKIEESSSNDFYNPCKEKKNLSTSNLDPCQKKKNLCERKPDSSKIVKSVPCKSKEEDSRKNKPDPCKKKPDSIDRKKEDNCLRLNRTKSVDNVKGGSSCGAHKTKPSLSEDGKDCNASLKMANQKTETPTCPCPNKLPTPPSVDKKPIKEKCSKVSMKESSNSCDSKTEKSKPVPCKKTPDDKSATSTDYDVRICKTAPRSRCPKKTAAPTLSGCKKPVEPCGGLSALEKKCLKMDEKKEQISSSNDSKVCKKSPDDKSAKSTERKSKAYKTAPKKSQKRSKPKSLQNVSTSLFSKTHAKRKAAKTPGKSSVAGSATAAKCGKISVCILGAGNWGSAIATVIGKNAKKHAEFADSVPIYVRQQQVHGKNLTDIINEMHENVLYLRGIKLPENILAVPDAVETAKQSDVLVFVLPHEYTVELCQTLKGKIKKNAIAISLIKGFIKKPEGGLDLISDIIKRNLQIPCSVLMGANIAKDVAKGDFSEATIGCADMQHAKIFRKIFHDENFRVVVVKHAVAVEVCGALKNIVALACGFCDGLKLGSNTKAAVIRLGLMEMIRFMDEFYPGNDISVYFESCGIADLITTCYGGRNRLVSEAFVCQNKSLAQLESEMLKGQKLQGPPTAVEVNHMLKAKHVECRFPLFTAVHQICTEKIKPAALIPRLRDHPEHERTMRTFMQAFKERKGK